MNRGSSYVRALRNPLAVTICGLLVALLAIGISPAGAEVPCYWQIEQVCIPFLREPEPEEYVDWVSKTVDTLVAVTEDPEGVLRVYDCKMQREANTGWTAFGNTFCSMTVPHLGTTLYLDPYVESRFAGDPYDPIEESAGCWQWEDPLCVASPKTLNYECGVDCPRLYFRTNHYIVLPEPIVALVKPVHAADCPWYGYQIVCEYRTNHGV